MTDTQVPRITVRAPRKHWSRSKIIRVNAIAAMLAVAESQLHVIQPMLPVSFWQVLAFVLPVVNVGLRFYTNTGVTK